MTFVDTNVVVDILEADPNWFRWSRGALATAAADGNLRITHIVLAELNARRGTAEVVMSRLADLKLPIDPLDTAIALRAGQAHGLYRSRGGERTAILADFLIGAHAVVRGAALITRDARRFAGYFPELTIISPESHP